MGEGKTCINSRKETYHKEKGKLATNVARKPTTLLGFLHHETGWQDKTTHQQSQMEAQDKKLGSDFAFSATLRTCGHLDAK